MYIATLHCGYASAPPAGLITGRSMRRAGTTTLVATRSTAAVGDALGGGEPDSGANVGRVKVGVGTTAMIVGEAEGASSPAAPVYDNRPPAMSDTPVAVRIAGRRRLRSEMESLPTGSASYQRVS
jgi:hypothetical protein